MQWSKCLHCYNCIELWLRISFQEHSVCFGRTPGSHLKNPKGPTAVFFGHTSERFQNDRKKLNHFGQNVWKYRLKNTVVASFNTTVRQMTEMFLWPKCLSEKKQFHRTLVEKHWHKDLGRISSLWLWICLCTYAMRVMINKFLLTMKKFTAMDNYTLSLRNAGWEIVLSLN